MLSWYEAIDLAQRQIRPKGLEYLGMAIGPDRARNVRRARDRMMVAHGLFCQTLLLLAFLAALTIAGVIFWPGTFDRKVLSCPIGGWLILLSIAPAAACAVFAELVVARLFLTDLRLRGLYHAAWAVFWTIFLSAAFLIGLLGMPEAISADVDRFMGPTSGSPPGNHRAQNTLAG